MSKFSKRRLVIDDDYNKESAEKKIKLDPNEPTIILDELTNKDINNEKKKQNATPKSNVTSSAKKRSESKETPKKTIAQKIKRDQKKPAKEVQEASKEPANKKLKIAVEDEDVKKAKRDIAKKVSTQDVSLRSARIKIGYKCLTKSKCVCDEDAEEPTQSQLLEDHEAHVLVAEWRLHKFQSPIELNHDESISHDHFEPLEFHGHWDKTGEAIFENTGKTAVIRFQREEIPYLIGGPLHNDVYIFEQLHFHWSDDDNGGCEHIFEGKAYSMEAHAVHYNNKYANFKEALDKPDGLAVIGFFLEATDNDDNPCFKKLTAAVQNIVKVSTSTNVAPDCLTWIKEEAQCKGYYTYQGSLTTEPYLESVTWILYPTPIHVSRQQVAHFRELKSTPCEKVKIVNNVRPIQTPPTDKKLNIFYARSHRKSDD